MIDRFSTLKALRYRNFRIYWFGLLVAILGWQFLTFAQLWLVYDLTGSTLYTGAVGGANGISAIVLSLFGGVLADRVDKRKLIIITQFMMAVLALALAVLTVTDMVEMWHVLVIAAFTGATSAFDNPARQALVPRLIDDPADLSNAVALSSSVWSTTRVVGPALAGVLIASIGPASCFFITASGYAVMVLALMRIDISQPEAARQPAGVLPAFVEGWRYVLTNKIFLNLIAITFLNSIFGMSFVYLLPVFAKDILAAGASGYGFLQTAFGIGGICGVLTVASIGDKTPKGRVLLAGNFLFCLMLIAFSYSTWYELSLGLIALAGFFNSLYMTNVMTLLQGLVPDELRGRVMGIYGLTWSLMPLGGLQSGALASILEPSLVISIGAVVILGFAAFVAATNSRIRKLT